MMNGLDASAVREKLGVLKENPKVMLAVLVVVVLLDLGLLVRWQLVSLGHMFTEARKLKADITTTRRESKNADQNEKNLKDLKAQQEKLHVMFVGPEELQTVLESIQKHANVCGVRVLRIQPIDDVKAIVLKDGDGFRRQKISIAANTGFHALGRFIAMLEGDPTFIDIKSLEIRADESEYTRQQVSIVLEVLQRNG